MSSLAYRPATTRLQRTSDRRARLAARIGHALAAWLRRAQSRTQLAQLSDRELRDIGLTPAEAAREYAKPFWVD